MDNPIETIDFFTSTPMEIGGGGLFSQLKQKSMSETEFSGMSRSKVQGSY